MSFDVLVSQSLQKYGQGRLGYLAFLNATRECQAFLFGVRAFRSGGLAWRSAGGVLA